MNTADGLVYADKALTRIAAEAHGNSGWRSLGGAEPEHMVYIADGLGWRTMTEHSRRKEERRQRACRFFRCFPHKLEMLVRIKRAISRGEKTKDELPHYDPFMINPSSA